MTRLLIVAVALVFAVARFFMPSHALSPAGSYEAFAHLFIGGLLGACFLVWRLFVRVPSFLIAMADAPNLTKSQREAVQWMVAQVTLAISIGKLCGLVALALSAVELTAFLLLRGR
jgi:hypothetical protein